MVLPALQAAHLESIGQDPATVVRCICHGCQSVVLEQHEGTENFALKLPISQVCTDIWSKIKTVVAGVDLQAALHEYDECKRYFGRYVVPTEFLVGSDERTFATRQPLLQLQDLTPEIVSINADVREQLIDILDRNRDMVQERGKFLDAMGFNPKKLVLLRPHLDNISIDEKTGELRIVDFGLLKMREHAVQYLVQCINMRQFGLAFNGNNKS